MRRCYSSRSCIIICLAIVFAMLAVPPALAAGTVDDRITNTQRALEQARQREKSALSTLNKNQSELNRIQGNLNGINQQLAKAEANEAYIQSQLRHIEEDLLQLEDMLDARRDIVSRRAIALWRYGPISYLEVIFSARSFRDLIDRYELSSYFIRHDMKVMDDYRQTSLSVKDKQKELEKLQEQLAARKNAIDALKKKAEQERQRAAARVQTTQQQYALIQADRVRLEQALAEYERLSQELGSEMRRKSSEAALGTGTMIWPVSGRITSPFGSRYHPVLKKKKFHNGMDIAVPSGTPVLAADSGVVIIARWSGGYGYLVAIDHGRKISTFYGHNSKLLVNEGDPVVKGQRISLSGNTGLSTGPHCHFEVRVDGNPVNPLLYLPPK